MTWIGPITVNETYAPAFACAACCEWADTYVRSYVVLYDQRPAT
ncbi:hypothetical protein ACIQNG_16520 [Streptomyces sp. NPDC091377]